MRVPSVVLLSLALLAGCLSGDKATDEPVKAAPPLSATDIEIPDDAALEAVANGFAAVWESVSLPFTTDVKVPEHATMMRAVASEPTATGISMSNLETGRRRCNNPTVESFSLPFQAPRSCSGITALDEPGAVWHVSVFGTGSSEVRVEFLDAPLDGLAAQLDLGLIDPPTMPLQETEVLFVPSFDGVRLRVEVTQPEGPGPWPAIIVSSPYNDDGVRATPADWTYVVQDWAKRGYAMVTADVRGFGDSGGCVEVWGANEQKDQKFLVDWVAQQPWSDGSVGFYGQSYVGTTPVEAAVQAPEALKAIVTVAPVINAYEDWHYGGVPNGENELSPVSYQALTDAFAGDPTLALDERFQTNPQQLANNAANGFCDPTLVARANDPRAVYNAFYEERNFKLRAKDVKAAVLYTEGFEDANVKAAMIPGWFNDLPGPKLGLFGHWLHQHPPRLDTEALMVGWFEQYLKGKDLGFDALPPVDVVADREHHRLADAWPPQQTVNETFWLGFGTDALAGQLLNESADGRQVLYLDSAGAGETGQQNVDFTMPPLVRLTTTLDHDFSLAGVGTVHFVVIPQNAPNAYVGAYLYEDGNLVTWGQFNVAHRNGHDRYEPAEPNEATPFDLPLRPTEHIFRAGSMLTLEIRGVQAAEATDPFGAVGARLFLEGGADGTYMVLPGVPLSEYQPIPLTAVP